MRTGGYSLIEVLIAASVVAIGLTAAAALVSTLMTQQELNAASLRAANLQEQVAKLYRLDLKPSLIYGVMPEACTGSSVPPAGGYSLIFSRPAPTNIVVDNTTVALDRTGIVLIYEAPPASGAYVTNGVSVVRPKTRVFYEQ